MEITGVTKISYELVSIGCNFDCRRYADGTWTTYYADIEREVDINDAQQYEKKYQEYKKKNQIK